MVSSQSVGHRTDHSLDLSITKYANIMQICIALDFSFNLNIIFLLFLFIVSQLNNIV